MNIDPDSLRASANHRRKQAVSGWTCHHCKRTFVQEKAFMSHVCKQKKRAEEIKTIMGQNAFSYYTMWMKARKFKTQSIDSFVSSMYYTSFINFANQVKNLKIDKPDLYIRLMVRRGIGPAMWCNNQAYVEYLKFCDKQADPYEMVACSLEVLERHAAIANVKIGDIFVHLGFKFILELIKLRQLSPWLLLHSQRFHEFLVSLDEQDLRLITSTLNFPFWTDYLEDKSSIRAELRELIAKFGI